MSADLQKSEAPEGQAQAAPVVCPDGQLRPLGEARVHAINQGAAWLMAQGREGFPDAAHAMTFPRWAGFHAVPQTQRSGLFSRMVIAEALAHVHPHLAAPLGGACQRLLSDEAEAAWQARQPAFASPYRYFPGLAELPPDADTLSAATLVFAQTSPQRLIPLSPALDMLEADALALGHVKTWQLSDADPPEQREAMRRGATTHWGDGPGGWDRGVNARAALALHAAGRGDAARRIALSLAEAQNEDGTFTPRWYAGEILGTALCLRALRAVLPQHRATSQAREALIDRQRPDGGWGTHRSEPHPTAAALVALEGTLSAEATEAAHRCLFDHQRRDGAWNESPWIAMPIQASADSACRVATFASRSVTTALCLWALTCAMEAS